MTFIKSKEIHLASRPVGLPKSEDFTLKEVEINSPNDGEVLVKNIWMSVDPYMRGRMIDQKSYVPPFQLDKVLEGGSIGVVEKSNSNNFKEGDFVISNFGWREYYVCNEKQISIVNPEYGPLQAYLGALGMPGLTAYVGLLEVGKLNEGENVLVSAAAGAVGSVVCQIAKAKKCKVYGTTGSDKKCSWLENELGVDKAINYKKTDNLIAEYRTVISKGIDVYFDNVGGDHLEAGINILNINGRIALCGMINQYNDEKIKPGPSNLMMLIVKNIRMEGFIVSKFDNLREQFLSDMKSWINSGEINFQETIHDGIENSPKAFINLFSGENTGKMLVKIS
ncbi:MAG: NADP-dependent oxidoreductase [Pseudomonadota bacterium]|nr:NADP-dependent oxidoreductase [Pseudomonadota bacterium]